MRRRVIYSLSKREGQPFQGELMICTNCHLEKLSDPNVESGWTAISYDGESLEYYCPKCFNALIKVKPR